MCFVQAHRIKVSHVYHSHVQPSGHRHMFWYVLAFDCEAVQWACEFGLGFVNRKYNFKKNNV